jgi:uncharacterized RDD family membrane protein YckC
MYKAYTHDGRTYDNLSSEEIYRLISNGEITAETMLVDLSNGSKGPASDILRSRNGSTLSGDKFTRLSSASETGAKTADYAEATLDQRFIGYAIDLIIALPLGALAAVPFVGLIGAPALCIYWLLRDSFFNGQSIGKRVAKTRVLQRDGTPITAVQSCQRNIVYSSGIVLMIPFIGEAGFALLGFLGVVDLVMVLATRRRLGDNISGTYVAKDPFGPNGMKV